MSRVPSAGPRSRGAVLRHAVRVRQEARARSGPRMCKRIGLNLMRRRIIWAGFATSLIALLADGPLALSRTLYQLSRQQPLQNQFDGGHGFTGLVYVRAPTSAAELQYWCTANEER